MKERIDKLEKNVSDLFISIYLPTTKYSENPKFVT